MKQKIIIGFSVILLVFAVALISYDLFHESPTRTAPNILTKRTNALKNIDTSLVGYKQIQTIETELKGASGIAVEKQQIYVCGKNQVVVYSHSGDKLSAFTIDSSARCIEVSGNDIYLGTGPCVTHYSTKGNLISRFKPLNEKGYITSIATDNEFVYVADAMNKIVLKYTLNGNLAGEIGTKDSLLRKKGFVIPSLYFDVETGGYNDLWVANTGYLRLENFSTSGRLRTMWGKASYGNDGFPGCCNPAHFSLLPDGSFVTYEKGLDKVKVFDPAGQFKYLVAGAGSFKGDADFLLGHKNLVKDIDSDIKGNVYILDAYNRICIFKEI